MYAVVTLLAISRLPPNFLAVFSCKQKWGHFVGPLSDVFKVDSFTGHVLVGRAGESKRKRPAKAGRVFCSNVKGY